MTFYLRTSHESLCVFGVLSSVKLRRFFWFRLLTHFIFSLQQIKTAPSCTGSLNLSLSDMFGRIIGLINSSLCRFPAVCITGRRWREKPRGARRADSDSLSNFDFFYFLFSFSKGLDLLKVNVTHEYFNLNYGIIQKLIHVMQHFKTNHPSSTCNY